MPATILTDTKVPEAQKSTHAYIKELPIPERGVVFYNDKHVDAPKGLLLKVAATGTKSWVLRYKVDGQPRRYTLGHYPDWKPTRARKEGEKLRRRIWSEGAAADPIAIREAEELAQREALEAEEQKTEHTLGKLLEAYAEHLRLKGKASARAVDNSLKKNVKTAFPKLWRKPAADIDLDDCFEIVARLVDAGKLREAGKLRSYLRAAYTAAIRARTDATIGPALRRFKLGMNPAAALATIEGSTKARDRVLSLEELRHYWQRISALPDPDGAVLRFHLLTGGQRLEQLFRLTTKDRDGDAVTLFDPKGRRQNPRVHLVPLLPAAVEALYTIGNGPHLVSFDNGKTATTDSQFRARVSDVCDTMLEEKEIAERFTPGDMRRTVETRLTAAGVTSDTLKHLLSHGFGGVQDRHYQRYEYQAEKLDALNTLYTLLTQQSGDVVPMKRSAKK